MRALILPAAIVLISIGCHQEDSESVKALRWVESADPIADAKAAIAKGNFKLKGVYGLTLVIPGADHSKWEEYRSQYGVDPIKGTTDAREGLEHGRLIELAATYAEAYNRQILSTSHPTIPPAK